MKQSDPRTIHAHARPTVARCLIFISLFACLGARAAETEDARIVLGRERITQALTEAGYLSGAIVIETNIDPASPLLPAAARRPEGFALQTTATKITITGADAAGALYGCLEVADRVRRTGELPPDWSTSDAPKMELRGPCLLLMKLGDYNFPVTPEEFPYFYDRAGWVQWLDRMAELRFNTLALWNGHPFAYFVKFDRFAEAQSGIAAAQIEQNREQLHWLIREAKRRNIRLVFQFYNIHTSVYFQQAHNLPSEIRVPTPLLRDYNAYAIETFAREFPEVGYYITPGEAIELKYTDTWVNDVLIPAMRRGGTRGPIWLRSWGTDLAHAKNVAEANPDVWMERKFNVEMIADTRPEPENREWAALNGRFIVNIHMAANLEPFRWCAPEYIRQCVANSLAGGANGLHLYPRKAWRWPEGSEPGLPLVQWERDWSWYLAWARYSWNPDRDPVAERRWWEQELARHFGDANAASSLLDAQAAGADVLPGLQRLIWLGDSNHTILASGIRLPQLEQAPGIPFLKLNDVAQRIPAYLAGLRAGTTSPQPTVTEFIDTLVEAATRSATLATQAAAQARHHRTEAEAWARDTEAVRLVARYYQEKMQAAVLRARAGAPGSTVAPAAFLAPLEKSLETFRELSDLLAPAYDSISDVPAWHPTRLKKVPFHWSDLVPLFERELELIRQPFDAPSAPPSPEPVHAGLAGLLYGDPGRQRVKTADPVLSLDLRWADPERGRGWSAEWRGTLIWPQDGNLTLRVRSDQAVRIEARGEYVLDGTGFPGTREVTLSARRGEAVPVTITYDHPDGKDSFMEIQWGSSHGGFKPIPAEALRHSDATRQWADSALVMSEL